MVCKCPGTLKYDQEFGGIRLRNVFRWIRNTQLGSGEIRTGNQDSALRKLARLRERVQKAHFDGLIEMEFPGASVVIKTICYVGVLLNLTQGQSGSDGVDSSGGDEKRVAGRGVEPLKQVLDLAREGGFAQSWGGNGFAKASGDLGAGLSAKDMPHLSFAAGVVMRAGVGVAGMDLHGEFFRGEEKFD
jgi:hypothetical protein